MARDIYVDADEYADVMRMASRFDKELGKQLRRQIRQAAEIGRDSARRKVAMMPNRRIGRHVGGRTLRQALADGLKVQVWSRKARIVQSPEKVRGENARGLPRRLDAGGEFQHPVFQGADTPNFPVRQRGFPYFNSEIDADRKQMVELIGQALEDAAQAAARGM